MAEYLGNYPARARGGSVAWETPQASVLLYSFMFPATGAEDGIVLTAGVAGYASVGASDARLVVNSGVFHHRVPIGGDSTVAVVAGVFSAV